MILLDENFNASAAWLCQSLALTFKTEEVEWWVALREFLCCKSFQIKVWTACGTVNSDKLQVQEPQEIKMEINKLCRYVNKAWKPYKANHLLLGFAYMNKKLGLIISVIALDISSASV